MKNIRDQAVLMGHAVVGKLKRLDNCTTRVKGQDRNYREYQDEEGTIYTIDWRGNLVTIYGDDWCI